MKLSLYRIVSISLLFHVGLPLHTQTNDNASPDKKDDLARVAIMEFFNESGSKDYDWVEKSLPDAINNSMKARFEFVRQQESQVAAVSAKYNPVNGEYLQTDADKIALESQSDILIYGNFRMNAAKDRLQLKAIIYNAQGKKVIGIVEDQSPLNNKIFEAIDRMAMGIVKRIYSYQLAADSETSKMIDMKILVLVPSFTTAEEEKAAIRELDILKNELSETYMGRYVTLYEFFEEKKINPKEREKALGFAKKREREKIIAWLADFGVKNAFIVLVADNKVAITPVAEGKSSTPVSYSVNAKPEEKRQGIAKASKEVSPKTEKVELKKGSLAADSLTLLHIGVHGGRGLLEAGDNLGVLTGINVQFATQIWKPWFQPIVKLDTYYALEQTPVDSLIGASLTAGFSYTWLMGSSFAFTPYVTGGAFAGVIRNSIDSTFFYLPVVGAGASLTYFVSPAWGISIGSYSQYVLDASAPALFITGSLAWVYRF